MSSAANMKDQQRTASDNQGKVSRYWGEIKDVCIDDSLHYTGRRRIVYPAMATIAEDLLAALASKAYGERIFFPHWLSYSRKKK